MVEGKVPQSSRHKRFQVPCMVEGKVSQSSRQEKVPDSLSLFTMQKTNRVQ